MSELRKPILNGPTKRIVNGVEVVLEQVGPVRDEREGRKLENKCGFAVMEVKGKNQRPDFVCSTSSFGEAKDLALELCLANKASYGVYAAKSLFEPHFNRAKGSRKD